MVPLAHKQLEAGELIIMLYNKLCIDAFALRCTHFKHYPIPFPYHLWQTTVVSSCQVRKGREKKFKDLLKVIEKSEKQD